jgi:hypothetical protein
MAILAGQSQSIEAFILASSLVPSSKSRFLFKNPTFKFLVSIKVDKSKGRTLFVVYV